MAAYLIAGLTVDSDLALPGAAPAVDAAEAVAVTIRGGDVPTALDAPDALGPNWAIAGDTLLIAIPGIVRMLISGGREIAYALDPGIAARDAAIFVGGTGFGLLLHQRGQIVLHASAVRVGDSAVLFCGPSGAGKSTLAAALVDRGHELVADDFCAITLAPGHAPLVHPDGRQLKLWRHAIERLSLASRQAEPVRTEIEKYYVEPHVAAAAPLPLAVLYGLREARPPLAAGIEPLSLVDAAALVRHNAYRRAMVGRMGQGGLYFDAAVAIARQAGLFLLTRDFGFAEMPMVIGWLEAHWRTLGLVERAA